MTYYCNIIIRMEMEKSKVLLQFLLVFRQSGDVLFLLYARRLRGYTATQVQATKRLVVAVTCKFANIPNCSDAVGD